jgi:hypothetical protein
MRIKDELSNLVLGLIEDKTIINSEVTVLDNITIEKIDGRVYYTIDEIKHFVDSINGTVVLSRNDFNDLDTPLSTYGVTDDEMCHIVDEIANFMRFWSIQGDVEEWSGEYENMFNEMMFLIGKIHGMKTSEDLEY